MQPTTVYKFECLPSTPCVYKSGTDLIQILEGDNLIRLCNFFKMQIL